MNQADIQSITDTITQGTELSQVLLKRKRHFRSLFPIHFTNTKNNLKET
jgi:hypothetical protein